MLRFTILALSVTTFGNGLTIEDANFFFDAALKLRLPGIIRNTSSLYPKALLPPETYTIRLAGLPRQSLELTLSTGIVKGFDVAFRRLGDCRKPTTIRGITTMFCDVDFSGLNITYTAQMTEGFDQDWSALVYVKLEKATALIGVTYNEDKEASLRSFLVLPMLHDVAYSGCSACNPTTHRTFLEVIDWHTRMKLFLLLHGSYKRALEEAVEATCFPCGRSPWYGLAFMRTSPQNVIFALLFLKTQIVLGRYFYAHLSRVSLSFRRWIN